VLTLWAIGFDDEEAAATLGVAVETVHHHGRALRERVVPAGLDSTRANAVGWAWLQSACCTASAFVAVLNDYPTARQAVRALAEHHVDRITQRQSELLLLHAFGLSRPEAGSTMTWSQSTLRSTAREARLRVVPPGMRPTRGTATAWTNLHFCILHRKPGCRSRFGEIWQKMLVR